MAINPLDSNLLNLIATRGERNRAQILQGAGLLTNALSSIQSGKARQQQYDTENQLAREKFEFAKSQGKAAGNQASVKDQRRQQLFDITLTGRLARDIEERPLEQREEAYQSALETRRRLQLNTEGFPANYDPVLNKQAIALSQSIKEAMAGQKAPQSQNIVQGNETVSQQWNPQTGLYDEIGRGPRWEPKGIPQKRALSPEIMGPDNYGDYYTVDLASGTKKLITNADQGAQVLPKQYSGPEGANTADNRPDQQQAGPTLIESVSRGTGPYANIRAGLAHSLGALVSNDAWFSDTTDARQTIRSFSQNAKRALSNNKRYPVAESKIIQDLLPDPDTFFQSSATSERDIQNLRSSLKGFIDSKNRTLGRQISNANRKDTIDEIATIQEIIYLIDNPPLNTNNQQGGGGLFTEIEDFGNTLKSQNVPDERILEMIKQRYGAQ